MSFPKITTSDQVSMNSEGTFGHLKSQYTAPDAGPIFQTYTFPLLGYKLQVHSCKEESLLIYQENNLEVRAFTIFLEYIYLAQNK